MTRTSAEMVEGVEPLTVTVPLRWKLPKFEAGVAVAASVPPVSVRAPRLKEVLAGASLENDCTGGNGDRAGWLGKRWRTASESVPCGNGGGAEVIGGAGESVSARSKFFQTIEAQRGWPKSVTAVPAGYGDRGDAGAFDETELAGPGGQRVVGTRENERADGAAGVHGHGHRSAAVDGGGLVDALGNGVAVPVGAIGPVAAATGPGAVGTIGAGEGERRVWRDSGGNKNGGWRRRR